MFKIFKATWKMQQFIEKMSKKLDSFNAKYKVERLTLRISIALLFISIILSSLNATTLFGVFIILFLSSLVIYIITEFILKFKLMLVSVRLFFSLGTLFNFLVTVLFVKMLVSFNANHLISEGISTFIPRHLAIFFDGTIIIFFIAFGIVWNFLSILANSKVASMSNTIVAGVIAIILVIASTSISMCPENTTFGLPQADVVTLSQMGYSPTQLVQMLVNAITVPFLIINGIAIILSQLKSYWIEKYNNGQEITW